MTPEEKQAAVEIVAHSDEPWEVECTKLLCDTCKVTISMLMHLHTCLILASENPSHTTRGLPQDEAEPVKIFIEEEKAKAEKQRKKANSGLNMLQLNPSTLVVLLSLIIKVISVNKKCSEEPQAQ